MLDIRRRVVKILSIDTIHIDNMHEQNTLDANSSFAQKLASKYPIETIRDDIATVLGHYIRTLARAIGTDLHYVWRMPQIDVSLDTGDLFNPDRTAADMGLTYDQVRHTDLARYMEALYSFAVHARLDASVESMTYESLYMWIADTLMDAADGHVAEQWDSYIGGGGTFISESANRCLQVAELANARHILENGEGFSYFSRRRGKKEISSSDLDSLTIGQLALLADMEEMSVRAAANPKRATPLRTDATPEGTRIARDVAKAWLQEKGRYIPVVQYWSAGDVDLQNRRFKDPHDLLRALDQRRKALIGRLETNTLDAALLEAGLKLETFAGEKYLADEVMTRFDDAACMTTLAGLLELPAPWLALRAREAATLARLADVERELKVLSQPLDDA